MPNNHLITLIIAFSFYGTLSFAQIEQNNQQSYDDEFATYEAEFTKNTQKEISDPLEKMNRKIFAFNNTLDIYLIEPVARAYRDYTTKAVRTSLHNFVTNLTLPLSALNSFAQGKVENGLATSSNFLINSTIGIAGLFDVAGNKKIKYEEEDFGQTLGYYGVKNGPYLMLPILGPSTSRDFGGYIIDRSVDPMGFNLLKIGGSTDAISIEYRTADATLIALDLREQLLDPIAEAKKDSFDLYATLRSVYIQQRDQKIKQ
ncbi:MAG: VacJ family lipoprotein [Rickettsiales bacterium]|nr:VacJ family lipoprotein [Rickettsiales bacterium]